MRESEGETERERGSGREREREGVSEWITVRNRRGGKPRREHLSDREDPRQLYRGNGLGQHANYQHQNWRNRTDITSYYFTRFPDDASEKDLWTLFKLWGDVKEVFISKQRNMRGRRYGFVRFKGVSDKNRLEKQLDSIIFGGLKMYVNLPRYGRAKAIPRNRTPDNGRQGQQQKQKGGAAVAPSSTLRNDASNRTYAEIVATNKQKEGHRRYSSSEHGGQGRSHSTVTLNIPQGPKRWYTDAWVGRLKKIDTFERAEDEITWTLGSDVTPKYLGDDMVILLGLMDMKAEELVNEEADKGTSLFYSLEKWKPEMKPGVRLVWIQCWGLPLDAWDIQYL